MRIIKLSKTDPDFPNREAVHIYFFNTLPNRNPKGQFFLPSPKKIGEDGVYPGERLLFAYQGECFYKACAASARRKNTGKDSTNYPYYFLVDVSSIEPFAGTLADLERKLHKSGIYRKAVVKSREWAKIEENDENIGIIEDIVGAFTVPVVSEPPKGADLAKPPERVLSQIYRIVRDTKLSRKVKELHGWTCQWPGCGYMMQLPNGKSYAEGHHVRPLGKKHKGRDVMGNILCLCPNHHAALDFGVSRISLPALRHAAGHAVDPKYVSYHNRCIYGKV